jgi:hypothetical protein
VGPEFKSFTVRLISETSTLIAALKNKGIDLSQIPAQKLTDLKAAGIAVEVSPAGGNILNISPGELVLPEDKRYNAAYHNQTPWVDPHSLVALKLHLLMIKENLLMNLEDFK